MLLNTAYSVAEPYNDQSPAFEVFRQIFQLNATAGSRTLARSRNTLPKARIVFETIFEPIVVRFKAGPVRILLFQQLRPRARPSG